MKIKPKIGDFILAGAIFLASAILLVRPFLAENASFAELVLAETGEVVEISLTEDSERTVISRGVTLTVTVSGGALYVSSSDCRDGICRSTPQISRAGQSIVCAPAGVVLRVVGGEAYVDGVSG